MGQTDLEQLLGQELRPGRFRLQAAWLAALGLLGAAAFWILGDDQGLKFITAPARRGELTVTVTATGELKPRNQVEVGTEVSGTIKTVLADYNDRVARGQVLAVLDTAQLEARKRQIEAALALAKARLQEAEATLSETQNKLERAQRLAERKLISQEEYEIAQAAYLRAQAARASAAAQVEEVKAQLDEHLRLLDKAVIRAPIAGVVLKRQVEPGQTVAASLQTPVLFVLAETLRQMELHVAVDEADVGQVREGQRASFTVDAYPERRFEAVITQVRYAPQIVDGVVTYETVLAVDNSDLALRPGMTATAEIVVKKIQDALLVPNAALRFTPPILEEAKPETGGSVFAKLFPRPKTTRRDTTSGANLPSRVFVVQDGALKPIPVTAGASDGAFTQILAGDIQPGTPLVVDIVAPGQ
ncbi:efflux RND transporter periplasmic adaptor subunit [Methylothermus subterraneus]